MSDYKYKFSIISAVYNVEIYLAEAIESIISQTIGFKNIQFILVDDGSPDNSGRICDEYAAKYPDNIFVVHKENGGAASARNAGLPLVQGKYVNFFDGDDKLTPETLSLVWDFFEKHNSETDVVSIPLMFFDGQTGSHVLNNKFEDGTRVINLNERTDCIQLSMSSAFIKKEALCGFEFDTRLSYAEDAQLLQKILLEKQTLGVVAEAEYMYRRRTEGPASAIQKARNNPEWYLPYMYYFQCATLDYAKAKYGYVPRFIQGALMYDLQWRLRVKNIPENVLTEDEKKEHLQLVKTVLKSIDDDIIMSQKSIFRDHKLFAIKCKYQDGGEWQNSKDDVIYRYSDNVAFWLSGNRVNLDFADADDNVLKLEGFVNSFNLDYESFELLVIASGEEYNCDVKINTKDGFVLDEKVSNCYEFKCEIPLDSKSSTVIKFAAKVNGKLVVFKRLTFGQYCSVNSYYKNYYIRQGNFVLSVSDNRLYVLPATAKRILKRKIKYFFELFINSPQSCKAVFVRLWLAMHRLFKKKPVWLISDRASLAGDNGEALFRYLCENHKEIDARYVISSKCDDYKRIKKIGPVVKRDSIKHKHLALLSEYIISSHAEGEIYNPLRSDIKPYKDLWLKIKFVFLQHGVTQNDVSSWLGKRNKRFYSIVSAAFPERDAFIKDRAYGYDEENIWLTGFCRFDRLYNTNEKLITIMPTWRKYLTNSMDTFTGVWQIVDDFCESDFYKFYNGLLTDEKILDTAKRLGYKIQFILHPNLRAVSHKFSKSENLQIIAENIVYSDVYAKSALMITDYSSAVFDFSYLRKPIIYAHFDKEEFFGGKHGFGTGYFDYERDGFGEVEYDLASTVDRIIEYMENGCKLKDEYRTRIDSFFAFDDKNNCERVYQKLISSK